MEKPAILVLGDRTIDVLERATAPDHSQPTRNGKLHPGILQVEREGGAALTARFAAAAGCLVLPAGDGAPGLRSWFELDAFPSSDGGSVLRIARARGLSGAEGAAAGPPPLDVPPQLLLLNDAGNGFRDDKALWQATLDRAGHAILLVRMHRPVAAGALWQELRQRMQPGGGLDPERVVVVVDAEDLRAQGVAISRRLSWERSAQDLLRHLPGQGALVSLTTAAHLVVRFGSEGVVYWRSVGPKTLIFDPHHGEGEVADADPGRMMGLGASFAAGLAATLCRGGMEQIEAGIEHGLRAAQRLQRAGFGPPEGTPDWPVEALFGETRAKGDPSLGRAAIPEEPERDWRILDSFGGASAMVLAHAVARHGTSAIRHAPVARFGALETADRAEIESYRGIGNLLRDFLENPSGRKRVSLCVFGPPGAGKSFGIKELAKAVPGGRDMPVLEFNLSQFHGPAELVGAWHAVRDAALSGHVPLVFFDEFDTTLDGPLGWLRHFLAPMQDGVFREGGALHPIGRAVLVFAGGTKARFADFIAPLAPDAAPDERAAFATVKAPDFVSRLHAYVDVQGPGDLSKGDVLAPLRRAILLRSMLARRAPGLFAGGPGRGECRIDQEVLRALLVVASYRHGARSMEAILANSALSGRRNFEAAALPPDSQLGLHVDVAAFRALLEGEPAGEECEPIATAMHQRYLKHREASGTAGNPDDPALKPWGTLPEGLKESNRAAARDIPRKLRAIRCFAAPLDAGAQDGGVQAFTEKEVEELARMEHDRWNAERLKAQWRPGARDVARRTTPYLRPWEELGEADKDKDRDAVRTIPEVLRAAGLEIFRLS